MWDDYGVPRRVPNNCLQYILTNEQINFIADLVTTVNDVFSFQIPFPFYVDQREEACIFERIDFIFRDYASLSAADIARKVLQVDLQYSDKEPAADWDGAGEDVEDENIQAMFDGPFNFGNAYHLTAKVAGTANHELIPCDSQRNVHYYPPDYDGLDAFFPVTVIFTNMTMSLAAATGAGTKENFDKWENVYLRLFFRTRSLTSWEKKMMTSEYYGMIPYA